MVCRAETWDDDIVRFQTEVERLFVDVLDEWRRIQAVEAVVRPFHPMEPVPDIQRALKLGLNLQGRKLSIVLGVVLTFPQ